MPRAESDEADFDAAYIEKITSACFDAIVQASRDPLTDRARLRNGEICHALLNLAAMMLATSEEAAKPARMQALANDFAYNLMERAAEARGILTARRQGDLRKRANPK